MARPRIDDTEGRAAVQAVTAASADGDARAERETLALAVRYALQLLAEAAPGRSVEVRVPPFGAVQIVEGPRHTRGTPPNIVEVDASTFLEIATGGIPWSQAAQAGRVRASGSRSDLSALFPLDLS
ncbi:MAG: sterol carrier family protein [Microcella sp.]|uniref:sterol carrier family protein n=1 Tax=Microcella sp. TaxID=1913979 RepID=UPI00331512CC